MYKVLRRVENVAEGADQTKITSVTLPVLDRHASGFDPGQAFLTGLTGCPLLLQWGFSQEQLAVAKQARDWQRGVGTTNYCDFVQIV